MGRPIEHVVPSGTRWCSFHKTHHLESEFSGSERSCREGKYSYHVIRRYGITPKEYEELIQSQKDKCAVCGNDWKYVDHNHKTGIVRGLLCPRCNTLIGFMETAPSIIQKALDYINKHNGE